MILAIVTFSHKSFGEISSPLIFLQYGTVWYGIVRYGTYDAM